MQDKEESEEQQKRQNKKKNTKQVKRISMADENNNEQSTIDRVQGTTTKDD